MRLSLVLALAALVGSGCTHGPLVRDAPAPQTAAGYPEHSVEQILDAVEASVAPVRSVAADGDLALESGDQDQGATFSLRARLSDSLTVVVRGPLGIEGGRGLVTPDSFFAADRINRQYLVGPVEAADRYVAGAGSSERVARAVLGLLVPERDVAWTRTPLDGQYRLIGRLPGGGSREYTIDPALWRVVRVREFNAEGRSVGSQTAGAFDTVDGVVLPRQVTLEGAGTTVRLEHRRLVVNPPDLRLRFSAPDDYEMIRIE